MNFSNQVVDEGQIISNNLSLLLFCMFILHQDPAAKIIWRKDEAPHPGGGKYYTVEYRIGRGLPLNAANPLKSSDAHILCMEALIYTIISILYNLFRAL